MSAKEYLSQAFWLDRNITSKLEQIESLNALATRATSILSQSPVQKTRNPHKTEDIIIKIIDLENSIKRDMEKLVDEKKELMSIIDCIPNAGERIVLEKRYLCFMPWEDIATEMNYSIQHVFRIHGDALKKVDDILSMRVDVIE